MGNSKYVSKKELWMYSMGGFGQGMIYAMMSSYISDYYVNVLQLPLMFVLLLMLLARVWDAINDPIMGIIIDKVAAKQKKMTRFIVMAVPFVSVLTILMYLSPDLAETKLMVYSAVVYVAWGMFYTVGDVPFWSLPNVMTPDAEERSYILSFSKIHNSVGSAFPEILFFICGLALPYIIDSSDPLEYNKNMYLIIAVICVIIGAVFYLNSTFFVKERIHIIAKPTTDGKKHDNALKRLFKTKPMILVILMGVLSSGRYMIQAAAVHVARYAFYIGPDYSNMTLEEKTAAISASVSTVKTIFQVCAIVGMFGTTLLMPYLMKKFDYKKLLITTCLLGFVASIFTTLIGWYTSNLYACIPFLLISCIPLGVINSMSNALIGDCLDYMELTTGVRDNALGSSCQGFINKLGSALSTVGIVIMYMAIGFEPSDMLSSTAIKAADELTRAQNFAMFSLVSIIPGISLLLCTIPMFFYQITGQKKKDMLEQLKARRIEQGILPAEEDAAEN